MRVEENTYCTYIHFFYMIGDLVLVFLGFMFFFLYFCYWNNANVGSYLFSSISSMIFPLLYICERKTVSIIKKCSGYGSFQNVAAARIYISE